MTLAGSRRTQTAAGGPCTGRGCPLQTREKINACPLFRLADLIKSSFPRKPSAAAAGPGPKSLFSATCSSPFLAPEKISPGRLNKRLRRLTPFPPIAPPKKVLTADLERRLQLEQDGLLQEDLSRLEAEAAHLLLRHLHRLARAAAPDYKGSKDTHTIVTSCRRSLEFVALLPSSSRWMMLSMLISPSAILSAAFLGGVGRVQVPLVLVQAAVLRGNPEIRLRRLAKFRLCVTKISQ